MVCEGPYSNDEEFVDAMKKIEKTLEQAMAHILSS